MLILEGGVCASRERCGESTVDPGDRICSALSTVAVQSTRRRHSPREAKVADLDVHGSVGEDVGGLEVAVDDVGGVDALQRPQDLAGARVRSEQRQQQLLITCC